jgi:hypothetical protein
VYEWLKYKGPAQRPGFASFDLQVNYKELTITPRQVILDGQLAVVKRFTSVSWQAQGLTGFLKDSNAGHSGGLPLVEAGWITFCQRLTLRGLKQFAVATRRPG